MEDDSERQEENDRTQESQNKKTKMEAGNSLYGSGKGSFVYENGQLVQIDNKVEEFSNATGIAGYLTSFMNDTFSSLIHNNRPLLSKLRMDKETYSVNVIFNIAESEQNFQ